MNNRGYRRAKKGVAICSRVLLARGTGSRSRNSQEVVAGAKSRPKGELEILGSLFVVGLGAQGCLYRCDGDPRARVRLMSTG